MKTTYRSMRRAQVFSFPTIKYNTSLLLPPGFYLFIYLVLNTFLCIFSHTLRIHVTWYFIPTCKACIRLLPPPFRLLPVRSHKRTHARTRTFFISRLEILVRTFIIVVGATGLKLQRDILKKKWHSSS